MNIVFPLLASGALYSLYSIHKKDAEYEADALQQQQQQQQQQQEGFSGYHGGPVGGVGQGSGAGSGVGISNAQTLGSNGIPQNYPVVNDKEVAYTTTDYAYANPNIATNEYLNQTAYQTNNQQTSYERYQSNGNNSAINNPIPSVYSLSGNYLDSTQFKHNNMVPFYGAKIKGQLYHPNTNETILDSMSGAGSQIIKKIEQAPLFSPQENINYAYGAPITTDFQQSRTSVGTKNNCVQPFESIRVGPGLGHEPGIAGSGGFNAGMEMRDAWLPKTVDELRGVVTNPKSEYSLLSHEGPAHSVVQNVGLIGQVEKYHPDTYFIQTQDRWLTTNGTEKQGRMSSEFVDERNHNRIETTQSYAGPSVSQQKTASYMPSNHQISKRIILPTQDVLPSSAMGRGNTENANNLFLKSHTNVVNHRSTTEQPASFIGGFSSAIGAVTAPLMEIFRPTNREAICGETSIHGVGRAVSANYVPNSNNLAPTLKETAMFQPNSWVGTRESNIQGYPKQTPTQKLQRESDCTDNFGNASNPGFGSIQGGITNFTAHKEVEGRFHAGGMNMFNNNVFDQSTATRRDPNPHSYLAPAFSTIGGAGPSTQTYGKINATQHSSEISGCDRINPDILSAFRDNPYTQSLINSA